MLREEFRPRTGLVNMKSKAVVGDRSLSCSQPELYAFLVMPWRVLLNEKCVLHVKCKSDQFHRPFRTSGCFGVEKSGCSFVVFLPQKCQIWGHMSVLWPFVHC